MMYELFFIKKNQFINTLISTMDMVTIEKGAFSSPSTKVGELILSFGR